MKKTMFSLLLLAIMVFPGLVTAASLTTNYGDVSLGDWGSGNLPEVFDLTQSDLVLTYTLDMSKITSPGWSIIEVGLREVGAPNIDPNLKGGFLLSRYANSSSGATANLNDYHALMKHGWSYEAYDINTGGLLISPGTYPNYAFWFDRDSVDQWQAGYWNYKDGKTYNTAGIYYIEIYFHAIDATTGTMFVNINGEQQGFYKDGYTSTNPPSLMPVGRTFTGDMTQMQVFYGRGGGGGTVEIYNISVNYTHPDTDNDGILDKDDLCPDTIADSGLWSESWGTNRWELQKVDGVFGWYQNQPARKGQFSAVWGYDLGYTYGCSGIQILARLYPDSEYGLWKFGLSSEVLEDFHTNPR